MTISRATFKIGPTPEEVGCYEGISFELTQNERTVAAKAAVHLEEQRRLRNREDDARALAGVLWQGTQA